MADQPQIPPRKRLRNFLHRSDSGAPPGTLIVHPDFAKLPVTISVLAFNDKDLVDKQLNDIQEVAPILGKYSVTWLKICGLGNIDLLQKVTVMFKLNSLAMEDVVNVHQIPKVEEYDEQYFAVARIPAIVDFSLEMPQISMFWGKNFVITFEEQPGNYFDPLIARIKHGGKRQHLIRPEYLAYALLDTIIDQYFPVLDVYADKLDALEEAAIDNPSTEVIYSIHNIKHDLHLLRRATWSQRDAIGTFKEIAMVYERDLRYFIRDCEDHTIQLIDVLESYRDRTAGLMDIYLSSVNNRTNRIVKVLTIIATIFMPLGVFASIYGMNFDRSSPYNMPELSWRFGYIYFWCLIITIAGVLIFIFWRKGWFKH